MKEFIRLTDVSTNSTSHTNLKHCYFNIGPGQITYLVGLHGSGKSTIKDVLCGNLPISNGYISIDNIPLTSLSSQSARQYGICSIDSKSIPLIPSLRVYENMEIYRSSFHHHKKKIIFHKKKALERISMLLSKYDLQFDPSSRIRDLSDDDVLLLCLLEAAYSQAKLIILNLSTLKLGYVYTQKLFHILRQLNHEGIALILICDYYIPQMFQMDIRIIRNGRIIKEISSSSKDVNSAYINDLLFPQDASLQIETNKPSGKGRVIGILELYYSNYSLDNYLTNLGFTSESLSTSDNHSSIKFIGSSNYDSFCDNLSIGENIALIRYPQITGKGGIISSALTKYLEEEFFRLLNMYNISAPSSIDTMSTVAKKILSVERWVMAGEKILAIGDPLYGLDIKGQNIMMKYFKDLKGRNIQLFFIFYNLSELQTICDTVHICDHGRITDSLLRESNLRLEDTEFFNDTLL